MHAQFGSHSVIAMLQVWLSSGLPALLLQLFTSVHVLDLDPRKPHSPHESHTQFGEHDGELEYVVRGVVIVTLKDVEFEDVITLPMASLHLT